MGIAVAKKKREALIAFRYRELFYDLDAIYSLVPLLDFFAASISEGLSNAFVHPGVVLNTGTKPLAVGKDTILTRIQVIDT